MFYTTKTNSSLGLNRSRFSPNPHSSRRRRAPSPPPGCPARFAPSSEPQTLLTSEVSIPADPGTPENGATACDAKSRDLGSLRRTGSKDVHSPDTGVSRSVPRDGRAVGAPGPRSLRVGPVGAARRAHVLARRAGAVFSPNALSSRRGRVPLPGGRHPARFIPSSGPQKRLTDEVSISGFSADPGTPENGAGRRATSAHSAAPGRRAISAHSGARGNIYVHLRTRRIESYPYLGS